MKKLFTLLLLLGMLANLGIAQNVSSSLSFDLGAGAIYPWFSELPYDYQDDIGAQASARIWYNINDISIGLEINYMQLNYSNNSGAYLKSHYLGLPLLVKREFTNKIYAIVGLGYAGAAAWETRPFTESNLTLPVQASDLKGFIYIPTVFGYRISDLIYVEARGNWGLSKMDKVYDYTASPVGLALGVNLRGKD